MITFPNSARVVNLMSAEGMTASETITANLDTRGADYATILINMSAQSGGTSSDGITLSLLSSDDTVVTNFATVVADVTRTSGSAHCYRYDVDCRSRKRYLRLSVSTGTNGTNENCTVAANAMLFSLDEGAGSTTEMVTSTNDGAQVVTG